MKRLRIAIDCDDVIVPTAQLIIDNYNKTYGSHLTLADMYSDDRRQWNAPDDETAIRRVDEYLKTNEYQQAAPFKEAIHAIKLLGKYHDLHVVTARSDFLSESTIGTLTQHFPNVFQSVEFTNFYGENPRSKSEVCQQLHADLLIDDHIHHAELAAKCGIDVFLFGSYPWNQGVITSPNIQRVKDWDEVLERLVDGVGDGL
jgi:uncharacterized HAD superfamily protein